MNTSPTEEENIHKKNTLNTTLKSPQKLGVNQIDITEEVIEKTTSQKQEQEQETVATNPQTTILNNPSYKKTISEEETLNFTFFVKKFFKFIVTSGKFILNLSKFIFNNYNSIWLAFFGYLLGMFYNPNFEILRTFICIILVTGISDYLVKIEKIELISKAKSEQKNISNLENILNDSNIPETSSIITELDNNLYTSQFKNND